MMRAPLRNRKDVPITHRGDAIGVARGAAIKVENRQGKYK
jgi:hypothetical protein